MEVKKHELIVKKHEVFYFSSSLTLFCTAA